MVLIGASDLTRTGDLLITSEMHYRLCYTSIVTYYNKNVLKCQGMHFNYASRDLYF